MEDLEKTTQPPGIVLNQSLGHAVVDLMNMMKDCTRAVLYLIHRPEVV